MKSLSLALPVLLGAWLPLAHAQSTAISEQGNNPVEALIRPAQIQTADLTMQFDPMIVRSVTAEIDFDGLLSATTGSVLPIDLGAGRLLRGVVVHQEITNSGRLGLSGTWLEEEGGMFSIVADESLVVGNFRSVEFGDHQIRRVHGSHFLRTADASLAPACGVGEVDLPTMGETTLEHDHGVHDQGAYQADDGSVFDVMILFTKPAQDSAGGIDDMNALVELAIIESNQVFANCGITARLRLVYQSKVGYQENGDFGDHLSRLAGTNDGNMDDIHAIRDAVGADLVALLVQDGEYCGLAYLMTSLSTGFASSAFSVTNWGCAVGNLTFAHELGHNMGCAHDRDNAGSALFSYSYGHRFFGNGGTQYRTVMSYSPGSRIGYFSNPNVNFDGTATGVNNSEDNVRSINNAAATIAQWRSERFGATSMLISLRDSDTIQGVSVQNNDIISVELVNGTVSMVIDMSDVLSTTVSVDAVSLLDDGSYVLSFEDDLSIPGLTGGPNGTSVDQQDLIRFVPVSIGDNTSGSFEFYFDGSDVGLTENGEDIDGASVAPNGDLYFSFAGAFDVAGAAGRDEDIVRFVPTSLGSNTSGSFSLDFDGSADDVKLANKGEDVDACHFHSADGDFSLSTTGAFRIPSNHKGRDDDVITFLPTSLGENNTNGVWMKTADGNAYDLQSADIDALDILD